MQEPSHMQKPGRQHYTPPDPSHDRLELLKDKLYSRVQPLPEHKHHTMRPLPTALHEAQSHPIEAELQPSAPKRNKFTIFFITALVFFLGAAGYASYIFFGGHAQVSADNVDIKIVGPVSVNGGDVLSLDVIISNNNPTDIELADLVIEYPDGTKSVDLSEDRSRLRESIGTIKPGQAVKRQVEAVLFGPEQSVQDIKTRLVYRVPDSNFIYEKEKEFLVTLAQSPLAVKISAFSELISGQEAAFTVDVTSNSDRDVANVLLKVDYPFGFRFLSSNVPALADNGVWDLGTIRPQETKSIVIRGSIEGNEGDERVFRFSTGTRAPDSETTLGAIFATDLRDVTITKPFLDVALRFDNEGSESLVVDSGISNRATIVITNNLDVEVTNLTLDAVLKGPVLDKQTVSVSQGYYRSADDHVLWDESSFEGFKSVLPGETVSLGLIFGTKRLSSDEGVLFKNPEIQFSGTVTGRRISENDVPEEVTNTIDQTIKVNSAVDIAKITTHSIGPFENSGPIPPKADQETSYTVTLAISNTSNSLADGRITAILPNYVVWNGQISPSIENVSFDQTTRVVTWNVGDVQAGAGYDLASRSVSFQVTLFPGLAQINQAPELLRNIEYTYFDRFSQVQIKRDAGYADTRIETDPLWDTNIDLVH